MKKFGGKEKDAFKDVQLEDKTIIKWYQDEGLERPIKTVRCFTGLAAVVPVKKDDQGNDIGFVKPGNNHHIAIYSDAKGNKHQHVCTFWHAVERKKYGVPVIINNTNDVWDNLQNQPDGTYPERFLEMLPSPNFELILSMQQNEMFLLNLPDDTQKDLNVNDKSILSKYLYAVWSVSDNDYWFRHHLETKNSELKSVLGARESNRYYRFQSLGSFFATNPVKIRLNHLGDIVQLG